MKIDGRTWRSYMIWFLDFNGIDATGYKKLFSMLHGMEFYAKIPKDENRASDGLYMRRFFFREKHGVSEDLFGQPCSVLEMLVGFARRMNTDYIGESFPDDPQRPNASSCFWTFMLNLGLYYCTDISFDDTGMLEQYVVDTVNRWMNRDYLDNGIGGLFPLRDVKTSQIDRELWDQMNSWLYEAEFGPKKPLFLW